MEVTPVGVGESKRTFSAGRRASLWCVAHWVMVQLWVGGGDVSTESSSWRIRKQELGRFQIFIGQYREHSAMLSTFPRSKRNRSSEGRGGKTGRKGQLHATQKKHVFSQSKVSSGCCNPDQVKW